MTKEQRIAELEAWAAEEGIRLPMSAAMIIGMEDTGATVDLMTGAITPGGAEQRVSLTVLGEATAIVNRCWEEG